MSSSDQAKKPEKEVRNTGKIIMAAGTASRQEMTVDEMTARGRQNLWNASVEKEYFERIRNKATMQAKHIFQKAQEEANKIKEDAYHQGYSEGIAQAQLQLDQANQEWAASLVQALEAVNHGCQGIWEYHRQDLVLLVRLVVEKALQINLNEHREEILTAYLDQAIGSLEGSRHYLLRVNPQDQEALESILLDARERHPSLKKWVVKGDPNMQAGGLLVETDHGMVDNTLEGRLSQLVPILDELELTFQPPEISAPDSVYEQAASQPGVAPEEYEQTYASDDPGEALPTHEGTINLATDAAD